MPRLQRQWWAPPRFYRGRQCGSKSRAHLHLKPRCRRRMQRPRLQDRHCRCQVRRAGRRSGAVGKNVRQNRLRCRWDPCSRCRSMKRVTIETRRSLAQIDCGRVVARARLLSPPRLKRAHHSIPGRSRAARRACRRRLGMSLRARSSSSGRLLAQRALQRCLLRNVHHRATVRRAKREQSPRRVRWR